MNFVEKEKNLRSNLGRNEISLEFSETEEAISLINSVVDGNGSNEINFSSLRDVQRICSV
jgi:hypothetical protein